MKGGGLFCDIQNIVSPLKISVAAKIKTGGNKKERFIEIIYPIFVTDENIGGVQSDRSSTSCIWKVVAQGEKANLDKIHISEKL